MLGEHMPRELKKLRTEWIKSRASFAKAQEEAVEARLASRPRTREEVLEGLQKHKGKGSLDRDEVLRRYKKMVTIRTVVIGAEEEELGVRKEGIQARSGLEHGKIDTMLQNAGEWYKRQPAGVRILATSALLTGGAALAAGSMMPLLIGGSAAGLKWLAEAQKNKNTKVSKIAGIVSRLTSVAAVAGYAGEYAVRGAHKALGTERKAQETLKNRDLMGDLTDVKNLKNISKSRKKALNVEDRVARQSRWGRIVGSVLGGTALGHYLHGGGAHDQAV